MADNATLEPIAGVDTLVDYLASGCKPPDDWRLGTEHEKFGFTLDDHEPLAYEGPRGIGTLLERFSEHEDWRPVVEDGKVIALLSSTGASVTLEPGGQLELSGALLDNLHQTCDEVHEHLDLLRSVAEPMGVGFLGMGFHPTATRDDIPWMPKGRYRIMRRYMPTVGSMGIDMMKRTCTVQVNLDFSSEADMVAKFRTALALQPVATALFANSPFVEGRPTDFVSYRSHVWEDTDPDRTGMLPFVFEPGMGFERYTEYVLDVPMYFVYRDGRYIDAAGQSFRDFMAGQLPALPGERPTLKDWEDHLTTVFPEVRLKRYLEMRGADGGPWSRLCALPAFWAGLLYHPPSLEAAWAMAADWTMEERLALRHEAPRSGLQAQIRGRTIRELATELLELSSQGLAARRRLNSAGDDETGFLGALHEIVESGQTPAERKLERWEKEWGRDFGRLFDACAY